MIDDGLIKGRWKGLSVGVVREVFCEVRWSSRDAANQGARICMIYITVTLCGM